MLYNTSILPYLTYCHIVWQFCKSSKSRKIKRIQKRALHAVYKSQNETYKELLIRGKLPNFMASRCLFELFMIKSTHQRLRNCDFKLPRFDTVAYGCATKDLSFGQRSVFVSSETWQASKHLSEHIRGVDLLSHIDDNSNCCVLCKFCSFYSFRF